MHQHHPSHRHGFTVIELLVTVAVAAVLISMAVPSFLGLMAAHRGSAAMNQMVGALAFARAHAIVQRRTVTLCPRTADTCAGKNQWHQGALVFVDNNGNGQLDGQDQVSQALPPLSPGERVYWRSFQNKSFLQFHARGYTAWQNGSFLYCPPDNEPELARMAIVNAAGRVRQARDGDGNGVVESAGGEDVECPP